MIKLMSLFCSTVTASSLGEKTLTAISVYVIVSGVRRPSRGWSTIPVTWQLCSQSGSAQAGVAG